MREHEVIPGLRANAAGHHTARENGAGKLKTDQK